MSILIIGSFIIINKKLGQRCIINKNTNQSKQEALFITVYEK